MLVDGNYRRYFSLHDKYMGRNVTIIASPAHDQKVVAYFYARAAKHAAVARFS